jgi:hypothetical protein
MDAAELLRLREEKMTNNGSIAKGAKAEIFMIKELILLSDVHRESIQETIGIQRNIYSEQNLDASY